MANISEDNGEETPLQVRLNGVATFIGIVGLAVALAVLVVLLVRYFTGHSENTDGSRQFTAEPLGHNCHCSSVRRASFSCYLDASLLDEKNDGRQGLGWVMAIVMALLSGFAGVYTEAIIKKRPSRNINVQNFWLYVFGMAFNAVAILVQDFDAVMNKGFFHGYSLITVLMILNHALSGIAVSMVMKYADNIVKVYSTSVAMLLTAVVSVFLFNFHLSLAFFLGSTVVSVSVYMHSIGKLQR